MKKKIDNRTITNDGLVVLDDNSLFESLFINSKYIENSHAKDSQEIQEYNKWAKIYDLPSVKTQEEKIDHKKNQETWLMPKKYQDLDIEEYLVTLCNTEEEQNRVVMELQEYSKRGMYNLLKYLVYLVEIMKKNNIVYGVGRGSSVASYCLYLIGIHRVNSLKYNLDIKEFLK